MIAARILLLVLILVGPTWARRPLPLPLADSTGGSGLPEYERAAHSIGHLYLGISNDGTFGPAEYPRGSFKRYLTSGGLWVGAVVDRDTLVSSSTGYYSQDFNPDPAPQGKMTLRSSIDPAVPWYDPSASHQQYTAVFTDTCSNCAPHYSDEPDGRDHIPLDIEVTRTSYAWAFDYSDDFVLLDYNIRNIGDQRLRYVYIGIYTNGGIYTTQPLSDEPGGADDMVGFLERVPARYLGETCAPDSDVVNMGWTADNDANLWRPQSYAKVYDIIGTRIIRAPHDSLKVAFNWWSYNRRNDYLDFGPQARTSYRPLEYGNYGTPYGDRARYHYLSNGERDYDQPWQVLRTSYDGKWVMPPAEWMDSLLTGLDPQYLLSFGPFGLEPGQTLPFTIAVVAGTHFHRDRHVADYLPDNPYAWYESVSFDLLARNAMWAEWIYDNPGVDTDSDGYAGEYTVCNLGDDSTLLCDTLIDTSADPDTNYVRCYWAFDIADTLWRKGDGIPDFAAAYPPPNPSTYSFVNKYGDTLRGLRVFPEVGRIRMVWSGLISETTPDPFSHRYDFEGYKVYIAHDDRPTSFSLVTSYDRENYNRWEWDYSARQFALPTSPFSLQQLRCIFADSCSDTTWHPLTYHRDNPLLVPRSGKVDPSIYYFEPTGYNRSVMSDDPEIATADIRKVYPYAPKPPHIDPDSIAIYYPDRDDTTYFTPDGYLKYYEYEYTFEGILPTVPYYVNVTAFDVGYPELGLPGLESDPAFLPKAAYPLPSSEVIARDGLGAYVYPNPYRLDGDYRERGFEANQRWHVPEDKTRLVHFANLPPKCTISIFSLDGDLIRELEHDVDPLDYLANHHTWNLINRNLQLIVSGLYYWVVEDDRGNSQIGKLVIIM